MDPEVLAVLVDTGVGDTKGYAVTTDVITCGDESTVVVIMDMYVLGEGDEDAVGEEAVAVDVGVDIDEDDANADEVSSVDPELLKLLVVVEDGAKDDNDSIDEDIGVDKLVGLAVAIDVEVLSTVTVTLS